jgi:adenine deaminase
MAQPTDPAVARLQRRIRVALGQEPGDVVLTGGRVVNVFTGKVQPADVVIADGTIAGVGPFAWEARERLDVSGRFLLPGLIDGHAHLESTLLLPAELARLTVPHGTSAMILDPHEVGNVLGVPGIDQLLAASADLPLDCFYVAPSCVPCTRWEHAGATLGPSEVADLLTRPQVLGLAEVMDFPAVLAGDPYVLGKVTATAARGAAVDGHAPGMVGQPLVAYTAAGVRSDHESTTVEEARAKADLGMLVQVREGSIARNLDTLLPLLVADELGDWCLCTDDVHPDYLRDHGHVDSLLRRVVAAGVPPARAVRHATLVPARHYGLRDRGAVAPGYRADLVVVDNLADFRPQLVLKGGRVVARDGRYVAGAAGGDRDFANTVHLGPLGDNAFRLPLTRGTTCPTIRIIPDQIVTREEVQPVHAADGHWAYSPDRDVLLVASVERHRATGQVGLGLVSGFGLKRGAIGSSVAHDSHNLVLAGTNARDLAACARALAEMGGGFVAVADGTVLARLPLPFAGLIAAEPYETVCRQLAEVRRAAQALGSPLADPFGPLTFVALPVIPELRITDQGMFHVGRQEFVRL